MNAEISPDSSCLSLNGVSVSHHSPRCLNDVVPFPYLNADKATHMHCSRLISKHEIKLRKCKKKTESGPKSGRETGKASPSQPEVPRSCNTADCHRKALSSGHCSAQTGHPEMPWQQVQLELRIYKTTFFSHKVDEQIWCTCNIFSPTNLKPRCSNRWIICPTRRRWTPSGFMAMRVRSLTSWRPAVARGNARVNIQLKCTHVGGGISYLQRKMTNNYPNSTSWSNEAHLKVQAYKQTWLYCYPRIQLVNYNSLHRLVFHCIPQSPRCFREVISRKCT